jgi:multisubunit Na+/H+ antiporter MnhB subunit
MAWLLPLILIVAGFLLWAGAYRPGGAFQAGSVLAAAGVLLRLAGVAAWLDNATLMRAGLALGLLTFLGIGLLVMIPGVPFLTFPLEYAGTLILLIELTLTLSIGLTLISLFRLTPPVRGRPDALLPAAGSGDPMSASLVFAWSGVLLFGLGLFGFIAQRHLLRRLLAFNIMGSGASWCWSDSPRMAAGSTPCRRRW